MKRLTIRQKLTHILYVMLAFVIVLTTVVAIQHSLNPATTTHLWVGGGIWLLAMIAFFYVLQTQISKHLLVPLTRLSHGMQDVARDQDYTVRAQAVEEHDEVGELVDQFNEMMHAMQTTFERQKQDQSQIRQLAYFDNLTGIANRSQFKLLLDHAIHEAKQNKTFVGVIYFDLDEFKRVNDTYGHNTGDALLRQVTERVKKTLRYNDIVNVPPELQETKSTMARLGGDEFTILIRNVKKPDCLQTIAKRIIAASKASFDIADKEIYISASVGIAIYPQDGSEVSTLLSNADIAMYHAKSRGKSTFAYYDAEMGSTSARKMKLKTDMQMALTNRQFEVHYQPKLDIKTGQIVSTEALVRWTHPDFGPVSPEEFIPLAEESDLIMQLGIWVMHEACRQTLAWQQAGFEHMSVAVNLSARQFLDAKLTDIVGKVLQDTGLAAECLDLELTEGMIMASTVPTFETLARLKALGVQLSIDDFGTGYSSLRYLSQFPIDTVKIDRSFIGQLLVNQNDALITNTIITLAHSLGLKVVAEGVETPQQLAYLKERQCDLIQGFLISQALPADALQPLLKQTFNEASLIAAQKTP